MKAADDHRENLAYLKKNKDREEERHKRSIRKLMLGSLNKATKELVMVGLEGQIQIMRKKGTSGSLVKSGDCH